MGHTAGHEQAEHPNKVVPQRVEERAVAWRGALPTKRFHEVIGEHKDGQEVGPEVSGLVGGPERWQEAVPEAVVGETVAGENEGLCYTGRDICVTQERQRLARMATVEKHDWSRGRAVDID